MKTTISMPDDLFKDIDKLSKKLNCSRSHIFTSAAREYIEKLKNKNIYEAINKAYSENETEKETVLREKHKRHYTKMPKAEKLMQ
ncbi:MAG: ribbon-helix-helix domain-containing protein [Candidatus Scalindua sp.]